MKKMMVWIGEQEAYNNGFLVGEWIELPASTEEITSFLEKIRKEASEAVGQEVEGCFYVGDTWDIPFEVGEYEPLHVINEKVEAIIGFTEEELKALKVLMDDIGYDFEDALTKVNDGDIVFWWNCWSMKDVAYAIAEETGYLPENDFYIDIEAVIRDAKINGDIPDDVDDEEAERMAWELVDEGIYNREYYFDFEAWGRDLDIEGNYFYVGDGLYIEVID